MTSHLEIMRHYMDVAMLEETIDLDNISTTINEQFNQDNYEELLEDLRSILFKMRSYQGNNESNINNLYEERGLQIAADMVERLVSKYSERQSYE
jgi:hypothetical protein